MKLLTRCTWGGTIRIGIGWITWVTKPGPGVFVYYSPDATPNHPKALRLWGHES